MEIKWLEGFVAVADLRNFSKAAAARHTSQPALSRWIKALELWYGVQLVDRSTYPVLLTPAGAKFLPVARQIITDVYRSRREARLRADITARSVKFAMPHSLATYFFPAWWRRQEWHLTTKATVVAADSDNCVELLRIGACQYLLCYIHSDAAIGLELQGVQRTQVGVDRLVPVSAVDAKGLPLFSLSPRLGETIPLLTYSSTSFLGRVTSGLYPKLGAQCRLDFRYESSFVEALKAEAILGDGIAWLPEGAIRSELSAGVLKIVDGDGPFVPLEIWLLQSAAAPGADLQSPDSMWSLVEETRTRPNGG